jgi:hypothetical protein
MQQATAPRECLVCIGIKTRYIETGSPWERPLRVRAAAVISESIRIPSHL